MKDDILKQYAKSLGDREARLLTMLSSQDKTIFTVDEAREAIGGSNQAIRHILSDLAKKKWLIRLIPGKYLIVPLSAGEHGEHTENWYVIAKNLIEPAAYYVSHYSALVIHEMTVQPVMTVQISSPIRRVPKTILGATYQFVFVQKKELWGIEDVWVTPSQKVRVSDLERTIVDCLDRPELCGGVSEVAKGLWSKRNNIDYGRIVDYAERLGRKSVLKRLGFLLETYGLGEEHRGRLTALLSQSYSLLDPSLPASGKYASRWKVRLNLDPDEIIEITRT